MSLSLAEQLRASHVKRWQIVNVSRTQNLAEHHFNVTLIVGQLARHCRDKQLLDPQYALRLMHWSLSHDMVEVRTGDTPTPYKRVLRQVGGQDIIDQSEEVVDPGYIADKRRVAGSPIEMYVEIADLIEAIWFLHDHGIGQNALDVQSGLEASLDRCVQKWHGTFEELDIDFAVRRVCEEIGI